MPRGREAGLARAFTLVELLVVIAIIGALSALILGVASHATKVKRVNRVKAELAKLVTAIESYKSKLGAYPPDNSTTNGINQLYYELSGLQYVAASSQFRMVDGSSVFPTPSGYTVKSTFNQDGFLNAHENVKDIKTFLELKGGEQKKEISNGVFVLAVPVPGARTNEMTDVTGNKFNPWRYDASSPNRHNPKGCDVWAEIKVGSGPNGTDIVETIGNWNSAK